MLKQYNIMNAMHFADREGGKNCGTTLYHGECHRGDREGVIRGRHIIYNKIHSLWAAHTFSFAHLNMQPTTDTGVLLLLYLIGTESGLGTQACCDVYSSLC